MRWIALFCVLVSVYPVYGQPPKVVVDVAIAATEAAKDDQPVMPDDFGQAARAVSAKWQAVESSGELQPGCTLYTADGDWCAPCKTQAKILIKLGGMTADGVPIWPFKIVKTNEMTVPQWVSDTGDVEPMIGPREAGLKEWIERRAKSAADNSPDKLVVEVDGSDSRSIVLALAEAVRRQDDTQPAVQGFLPSVPLDVNDDLLKVLDALIGKDGYTGEGFSVKWPAGKRKVTFEPGIQVWFRKVVEVDATITAIEIDGREVTLSLSGTILSQLTVRLK
jgi:thiol-disulfide isomerase/thioredoxin